MKTNHMYQKEKELLKSIAEIAGEEPAKKVKAYFSPEQWSYSWKEYLHKLKTVRTALLEGVPIQMLFDCVNAGIKLEDVLTIHRMAKGNRRNLKIKKQGKGKKRRGKKCFIKNKRE